MRAKVLKVMQRTIFGWITTLEIFRCDGKLARDKESANSFRKIIGRPGLAVQRKTSGLPSGSGLRVGLARFYIVMMPATSSEMEADLAEVSMVGRSECSILSLMRAEEKHIF